jgi:hypothetical protein
VYNAMDRERFFLVIIKLKYFHFIKHELCRVTLRISVDNQNVLTHFDRQVCSHITKQRRFPHAAFVVEKGYRPHFVHAFNSVSPKFIGDRRAGIARSIEAGVER